MESLLYGVGINDADYPVTKYEYILGKHKQVWICPYYEVWRSMLQRCHSYKDKIKHPCYCSATVCEEWLSFSRFKAWMESQDWFGLQLDKDILSTGSKHYSPTTCAFVPREVNNAFIVNVQRRGSYPLGVCLYKKYNNFRAQVNQGFGKGPKHLGYFDTAFEAHRAWQFGKIQILEELIDWYTKHPNYNVIIKLACERKITILKSEFSQHKETHTL